MSAIRTLDELRACTDPRVIDEAYADAVRNVSPRDLEQIQDLTVSEDQLGSPVLVHARQVYALTLSIPILSEMSER